MKTWMAFLLFGVILLAAMMLLSGKQMSHNAYCDAHPDCFICSDDDTAAHDLTKCPLINGKTSVRVSHEGAGR